MYILEDDVRIYEKYQKYLIIFGLYLRVIQNILDNLLELVSIILYISGFSWDEESSNYHDQFPNFIRIRSLILV